MPGAYARERMRVGRERERMGSGSARCGVYIAERWTCGKCSGDRWGWGFLGNKYFIFLGNLTWVGNSNVSFFFFL